jgi:hypothetical protein
LPRAARYLIPFSIFYFREYGIIARNYPMGVFFLLFAVWAYRKSKQAEKTKETENLLKKRKREAPW